MIRAMIKRVLLAVAVLALAACSSAGAPHSTGTTAAPAASASLDSATAGTVCAALNALSFTGDSGADAIATAARAHSITEAQVIYAIDHRCPQFRQMIPKGAQ